MARIEHIDNIITMNEVKKVRGACLGCKEKDDGKKEILFAVMENGEVIWWHKPVMKGAYTYKKVKPVNYRYIYCYVCRKQIFRPVNISHGICFGCDQRKTNAHNKLRKRELVASGRTPKKRAVL